jgi:hypothetical protein
MISGTAHYGQKCFPCCFFNHSRCFGLGLVDERYVVYNDSSSKALCVFHSALCDVHGDIVLFLDMSLLTDLLVKPLIAIRAMMALHCQASSWTVSVYRLAHQVVQAIAPCSESKNNYDL